MLNLNFRSCRKYNQLVVLVIFIISLPMASTENSKGNKSEVLSRTKRYLAFPEGSSFSVSICWTIGVLGNPNVNFLSFGLNWGVSYELPNETWVIENVHGFKHKIVDESSSTVARRARHLLYGELETALDSMGYGGRDCILRALCESKKFFFEKNKFTMEETLLRTIFSLPFRKFLSRDPRGVHYYDRAYHGEPGSLDCASSYPNCGFSLIALAFGKHSRPNSFM